MDLELPAKKLEFSLHSETQSTIIGRQLTDIIKYAF